MVYTKKKYNKTKNKKSLKKKAKSKSGPTDVALEKQITEIRNFIKDRAILRKRLGCVNNPTDVQKNMCTLSLNDFKIAEHFNSILKLLKQVI